MIDRLKEELRSRPKVRKGLLAAGIFFVLFTVTGFLILPPVVKSVLTKKLTEKLHRQVTIESVRINPFTLSMAIRGFVVRERNSEEHFVSFGELLVDLQGLSLFKKGAVIREVRLVKPYARVIRNEDLSYNFSDLVPKGEAGKQEVKDEPFLFSVNNIQVQDAGIDFSDRPKKTDHTLRDGNIAIPFISNRPADIESFVKPHFSAKINGRPFSFSGDTKLFADSRESSLDIDIRNLDIPHYLAYSPVALNYRVESGFVSTKMVLSYIQHAEKKPSFAMKGTVNLGKIDIRDRAGNPMITVPAVDLSITSLEPLVPNIHLSEFRITKPDIVVERDRAGSVNLQALVPKVKKEEGAPKAKAKEEAPLSFRVDTFRVTEGRVAFHDSKGGGDFSTVFAPLEIAVDHLSNAPDKMAAVSFSARTERNETLSLQGELGLTPLHASGSVAAEGIPVSKYAVYYKDLILVDMPKGTVDLKTRFRFSEGEAILSGLSADLRSLRVLRQGEKAEFLTVPSFNVAKTDVDFMAKEVRIGGISTEKGRLKVIRAKDGSLNLAGLTPSPEATSKEAKAKGIKESDATGLSAFVRIFSREYVEPKRPWLVHLKELSVNGYDLRVEDLVPEDKTAFDFERIALKGNDFSTEAGRKGTFTLSVIFDRKGYLASKGSLSIEPLSARLRLDLKKIPILSFQPYFTDVVKIYITDGHLSSGGEVSLSYTKPEGVRISYRGDASLNSFASVDKAKADDFLKWDSLHFDDMDVRYKPLYVKIGETALSDFYSRLIINADGTMNVQNIIERKEEKGSTAELEPERAGKERADEKTAQRQIEIEKVTLQAGTINFSDNYIKPNYSANLLEIGGRISGLSSEETRFADVNLRGKLNNDAPLEITGKINPLRDDLFVDLAVDFKDMDLSPVTPYSGRYLGYTIGKGKLSLSLQYLIVKRKLDAKNKIFFDQLTLGEEVESPEATKLPVRLAIALLKNRKGEIDLNVPVSGDLDDPKFSLGRVIIKILMNILVKAATSPFALLGSIFGGGEELSYVEFEYGSSAIGEEAQKKIDALVKALHERPSLKLEIVGHADMEKDREGLRQYLFDRKVKAQKFKELVKKESAPSSLEEVTVTKEEYPQYLKKAYKEEKFPKPRTFLGFAKDLPVPEMEKLMLTNIVIKDDDLRGLAVKRAQQVKESVLKSKQVETERVFLVEPKTLQPEEKKGLKKSRVVFVLK